jgi:hypothetical protein
MHWMYQNGGWDAGQGLLGLGWAPFVSLLLFLFVWGIVWKGWALWLAARRKEKVWFVVLLVVNTLGLLEIFYIFAIAKRSDKKEAVEEIIKKEIP